MVVCARVRSCCLCLSFWGFLGRSTAVASAAAADADADAAAAAAAVSLYNREGREQQYRRIRR